MLVHTLLQGRIALKSMENDDFWPPSGQKSSFSIDLRAIRSYNSVCTNMLYCDDF